MEKKSKNIIEIKIENKINELIARYPVLKDCQEAIIKACQIMIECYLNEGKLLIAGNGGSAADADHIVGELMKGFRKRRQIPKEFSDLLKNISPEKEEMLTKNLQGALKAIALTNHIALSTAFSNDVCNEFTFAQQLYGYGCDGDVFLGITTSGNSINVIEAAIVAKAKNMKVIALTGKDGGEIKKYADVSVIVPCFETYQIQEMHLPIYHWWCLMLEEYFFET